MKSSVPPSTHWGTSNPRQSGQQPPVDVNSLALLQSAGHPTAMRPQSMQYPGQPQYISAPHEWQRGPVSLEAPPFPTDGPQRHARHDYDDDDDGRPTLVLPAHHATADRRAQGWANPDHKQRSSTDLTVGLPYTVPTESRDCLVGDCCVS
eukprot:EG_transcript_32725